MVDYENHGDEMIDFLPPRLFEYPMDIKALCAKPDVISSSELFSDLKISEEMFTLDSSILKKTPIRRSAGL